MLKPIHTFAFALLVAASTYASEVGDISESESVALERRINTKNLRFFGFGPGNLSGLADNGFSYHLQTGWWREAHPNAAIRIITDFDFTPGFEAWKASGALGAVWLPSRSAISPFLGMDFGWGAAHGNGWANGFSLGASAGVQLFRTATTQMSLEGRSTLLLDRDRGVPWSNSLALSVHF